MKKLIFFIITLGLLSANSYAKINLNTAEANAIAHSTSGIGEKRAQAIVAYRKAHGPYHSIEDLANVPSFGKNFVHNRIEQFSQVFETGSD
jgi:competence protein ComEA